MFDELLCFGLIFVFALLVGYFFKGIRGTIRVGAVLAMLLFGFIVEERRGDETNGLFKGVFWVFPDEEVYEGGYATKQTLEVTNDQGRSEFRRSGTIVGFEGDGHCCRIASRGE